MTLNELFLTNKLNLSNGQIDLVEKYVEYLLHYNTKVNLISRKNPENVIINHILPCLIFSNMFKGFSGNFLDIGTGGGLPGVLFAIVNQKSKAVLIDSVQKKISALSDIVQKLSCPNVLTIWTRVENSNFVRTYHKSFDLIISRATSELKNLIKYSAPLLSDSSSVKLAVIKGGDLEQEINEANKIFPNVLIKKIPLIYTPGNEENRNHKFIVIVEGING